MKTLPEIKNIDLKIAEQMMAVRYAGYRCTDRIVCKYSWYVLIAIGISRLDNILGIFILIFGVFFSIFAHIYLQRSYREIQAEERALIELQARRSALWVEVMSRSLKTS